MLWLCHSTIIDGAVNGRACTLVNLVTMTETIVNCEYQGCQWKSVQARIDICVRLLEIHSAARHTTPPDPGRCPSCQESVTDNGLDNYLDPDIVKEPTGVVESSKSDLVNKTVHKEADTPRKQQADAAVHQQQGDDPVQQDEHLVVQQHTDNPIEKHPVLLGHHQVHHLGVIDHAHVQPQAGEPAQKQGDPSARYQAPQGHQQSSWSQKVACDEEAMMINNVVFDKQDMMINKVVFDKEDMMLKKETFTACKSDQNKDDKTSLYEKAGLYYRIKEVLSIGDKKRGHPPWI